MSMGLVLLIFDQGPNPGPSSDKNYFFLQILLLQTSLALFLLSSIWIWWISWILWMSIDLVTWGIQHTRPALTNKNQQSLHVFQINLWQTSYVTSSQNMIISPREQRLLCPGWVVHCCVVNQAAGILWTCFRIWKICCVLPGAARWLPLLCCCCSQHVCT